MNSDTKNKLYTAAVLTGISIAGIKFKQWYDKRYSYHTILELEFDKISFHSEPKKPELFGNNKEYCYIEHFRKLMKFANEDRKIIGIVAKIGPEGIRCGGLTVYDELRKSLELFKKEKWVYVPSILGRGFHQYFVLSCFDKIHLAPMSHVFIPGITVDSFFLKNMMEKIGVDIFVDQKESYKTAGNSFSQEKYTKEHEEQVKKLVDGMFVFMKEKILSGRACLEDKDLDTCLNAGILTSKEAFDLHIVDEIGFFEEMNTKFEEKVVPKGGYTGKKLFVDRYENCVKEYLKKKDYVKPKFYNVITMQPQDEIAIVELKGSIHSGPSKSDQQIYGEDVADTIDALTSKKNIRAIILRINSPGGSAMGSEEIRQAILRAKVKGKKVIASMSRVAASGGYWISMSCDKIIAEPMTITGSVGVIGVFFNFEKMFEKLGITMDGMKTNKFWENLPLHNLKEYEETLDKMVCDMYESFTTLVSQERKLPLEKVKEIAQGKVYLAKEAQELGLIDEIGGKQKAISVAKELLNMEQEEKIQLRRYPSESPLGLLGKMIQDELYPPKNSKERKERKVAKTQTNINTFGFLKEFAMGTSSMGNVISGIEKKLVQFENTYGGEAVQARLPYKIKF